MKKLIFVCAILIAGLTSSYGQEIGLRFGQVTGGNVAIDGIFSTGQFSRIHGDVSFGDGFGIDLLWDFLYRPLGEEAFNWYVGAGPYLLIGNNDAFGVAAEVGLEYAFNSAPLTLGFDYRPMLRIIDNTDLLWGGFGLNIRYVFGKN
jgi:hypothetical protein